MEKINVNSKIYEVENFYSGFLVDVYLLWDDRRDRYIIATVCEINGESAQKARRIAEVFGLGYRFAALAIFEALRKYASGIYSLCDMEKCLLKYHEEATNKLYDSRAVEATVRVRCACR